MIFGALDKDQWRQQTQGTAPLFHLGGTSEDEICFRSCLRGIGNYIQRNASGTFALLISDDYKERAVKERMKSAFLSYRERMNLKRETLPPQVLHDDMYFGDSRSSVGIQLADLCGYIISRRLETDKDEKVNKCFEIIARQIMYSVIQPSNQDVHPTISNGEMRLPVFDVCV